MVLDIGEVVARFPAGSMDADGMQRAAALGLVELTDDDRATLYGALLDLAGRGRGDDIGDVLPLWKRRGKRAFDAEAEGSEAQ